MVILNTFSHSPFYTTHTKAHILRSFNSTLVLSVAGISPRCLLPTKMVPNIQIVFKTS